MGSDIVLGGSPALQEQFMQPEQPWSFLTSVGIDPRGWGKNRKAAFLGPEKARDRKGNERGMW